MQSFGSTGVEVTLNATLNERLTLLTGEITEIKRLAQSLSRGKSPKCC
jgi:hypothetical protein